MYVIVGKILVKTYISSLVLLIGVLKNVEKFYKGSIAKEVLSILN